MESTVLATLPTATELPPAPHTREETPAFPDGDIWISVKDCARIMGVSPQAIRKACKDGKYTTRIESSNGGDQYRISLNSLDAGAVVKYYDNTATPDPTAKMIAAATSLTSGAIFAALPEWQRDKVKRRTEIIRLTSGMRGWELEEFAQKLRMDDPNVPCARTIRNWKKAVNPDGGIDLEKLVTGYGSNLNKTKVPDDGYADFKKAYHRENGPTAQNAWKMALGMTLSRDPDLDPESWPSWGAFLYRYEREIPEATRCFVREGLAVYNRRYGSYVDRDDSAIRPGQCWVSDHHQINVRVVDPATGKTTRPWVTVWRDYKSGKILSALVYCGDPNSDRIFESFFEAVVRFGLPEEIILDNGRDYRCRDFANTPKTRRITVDPKVEHTRLCCMDLLNIKVHFAIPYNAQTKPVERDFGIIDGMFCKFATGYTGINTVDKPEKLRIEIAKGLIEDFKTFESAFYLFIEDAYNNRRVDGKNLHMQSPNQVFAEGFTHKRQVTRDALKLFCSRTSKPVQIRRNGVYDSELGVWYWGDWMEAYKGTSVYLRRWIKDYAEAWVFNAKSDADMGTARIGVFCAPGLANTEVGKEQLGSAMAAKKRSIAMTKRLAGSFNVPMSVADVAGNMSRAAIALSGGNVPQPNPNILELTQTRMDKALENQKQRDEQYNYDLASLVPVRPVQRKLKIWASDFDESDTGTGE